MNSVTEVTWNILGCRLRTKGFPQTAWGNTFFWAKNHSNNIMAFNGVFNTEKYEMVQL